MALIATLIFVVILVSFGIALLAMTGDDSKLSTLQRESTRAFYLAETGIEEALWYMNSDGENTEGLNYKGPFPINSEDASERYEVTISDIETDSTGTEYKTLTSKGIVEGQGKYDKGTRTIEVKLKKEIAKAPDLFYDHAVLTDGNLTLNGNISFHGNVHSNSDLINHGALTMEFGSISATGTIEDPTGIITTQPPQEFPRIAWNYYESISKKQKTIGGNIYNNYYNSNVTFSSPETLYGIHFVNGNVTISDELILHNATILATGYIKLDKGNSAVRLENSESSNPLALVAKEYIETQGNQEITGDGIIQTEGYFDLRGTVNIKGAVYAEGGIFNGGGDPGTANVYYDTDLLDFVVPGTGIPVWVKVSWREK
jgi:hypothetical protein